MLRPVFEFAGVATIMAVPIIAHDLTMIDDADSNANWSGWGQNSSKWDDEADIYIEGAGSQGL